VAIHVRDLKDFFVSTNLYRGELTMNEKTIEGYQKNGFCARILEKVFEGAIKVTGFFKLNNQKATTMFDDYRVLYEKLQSSILNLFKNPEPEGPLWTKTFDHLPTKRCCRMSKKPVRIPL
jgi:hypothetical protein